MELDIAIDSGYTAPDTTDTAERDRQLREPVMAEEVDLILLELTRELYDMLTDSEAHPEWKVLYEDYKTLMEQMGNKSAHYIKRDPKKLQDRIDQLHKAA